VFKYSVVFAGNAIDIMLMHDHAKKSFSRSHRVVVGVSSPYMLAMSNMSNSTARQARLDALDVSNLSCRVET